MEIIYFKGILSHMGVLNAHNDGIDDQDSLY